MASVDYDQYDDDDEKRDITLSTWDNRWNLLQRLAESDNNDKLTDHEKDQLNDLLHYVDNINSFQNVDPSEVSDDDEDGIKWYPLLNVIFLICISSFIFGYITIETGSIVKDPDGHKGLLRYRFNHLTAFEKSMLTSSSLIGAAIGSFSIFAYSSCKTITYTFSRRHILVISNFVVISGGIIAIIAQWTSSWLTVIGFTLQGIGVGISSIMAPILIAELSPTPVRAFLTWFSQLFITFGMLISSLISWSMVNVEYGWMYVVFIGIIPSMIQLLLRKYIKKSPRLLIANSHKLQQQYANLNDVDSNICQEALDIIALFYVNRKDAQKEYDSITEHLISNENTCISNENRGGLLRMISRLSDDSMSNPDFRRSIFVGIFMNAFQQLSGCNVIFYNIQTIVNYNMYTDNGSDVVLVYGANFIATIICVFCVRFNFIKHRTLLFVGTVMMLTAVLLLGIINVNVRSDTTAHCDDPDDLIDKLALSKLPFYVFGYAISLSGFTWLINTELFPLCKRIQFGSFCVFIQWFFNALISLSVSNGWIDPGTTTLYFMCGVAILVCIGFIAKFIPETKGVSLEYSVRDHNPGIIWV